MKRGLMVFLGAVAFIGLLAALGVVHVHVTRAADDDPARVAEEWGHPGGTVWRWEPPPAPGSGMEMAIGELRGKPCILYRGAGYQGGSCFMAGWAVEAEFTRAVNGTLVVGFTIQDAATIRFGRGRDALRVPVQDLPHWPGTRYAAFTIPTGSLDRVKPNDIVALDARGRLLGRQHWNDGHGGFGALDGSYDRKLN